MQDCFQLWTGKFTEVQLYETILKGTWQNLQDNKLNSVIVTRKLGFQKDKDKFHHWLAQYFNSE